MGIKTLANYLDTILINFDKNNFYDQLKYFKKKIKFCKQKSTTIFYKIKVNVYKLKQKDLSYEEY